MYPNLLAVGYASRPEHTSGVNGRNYLLLSRGLLRLNPPSASLQLRQFVPDLRFRQDLSIDDNYYWKALFTALRRGQGLGGCPWPKFVEEVQFTHFLGSQRQTIPPPDDPEPQFHSSLVFRLAGVVGVPAIANPTLHCARPAQVHHPPRRDGCSVRGPPERDSGYNTNDSGDEAGYITDDSRDAVGYSSDDSGVSARSPALKSDIQRLSHFSPIKAWYQDKNFDSFPNLPAPIRSEQSASKEGKIAEVLRSVELLCANLKKTNIVSEDADHEGKDVGQLDPGVQQTSNGASNESSGGNTQYRSGQAQQGAVHAEKPGGGRKRKGKDKRSDKDSSDNEGHGQPRKRRINKPDPGPENQPVQCMIYKESGPTGRKHPRCNGRQFASFEQMLLHLLCVHIKPHQCEYCPKRFGRHSEQIRHQNTVCIPQKHDPVQSQVPGYIPGFGEKILKSTPETLYGILYLEGKKQYDLLDKTDALEMQPAPEEDEQTHAQQGHLEPLNLYTTYLETQGAVSRQTSSLQETNAGLSPFAIGDIHNMSDGLLHPINSLLDFDIESLFADDSLLPPIQGNVGTSSSQSMDLVAQIRATPDLHLIKQLTRQLYDRLPQEARDEFTSIASCKNREAESPMTPLVPNDNPFLLQVPKGNSYAEQVAVGGDTIPVPTEKAPDSAYGSDIARRARG